MRRRDAAGASCRNVAGDGRDSPHTACEHDGFPPLSVFVTISPPLPVPASHWRAAFDHPLLLGLLLLLPVVFLLPPLPIDETRYLAVAWEMRQGGEFLVPHLNGTTYAHKPPLLFWLINLGWLVTDVHAWTARAMTLLCSALTLFLLYRLTLRLTASTHAARLSMWFLLGTLYFGAFANAIMFDVPLTTCVLLAALGICDLADRRTARGIAITTAAIGLGILVKGPVMLLDVAFIALSAPWWNAEALAGRLARYYGALAAAVVRGIAIGLAWAIPAALHGGPDYAHAIFLRQTFDRIEGVKGASTHGRPWWWYGVIFPLMLLPWPLVLRGSWQRARALWSTPALRFALAWLLPTLLAFSLIAGKQPHYLLPMLPAVALVAALLVAQAGWHVRNGLFALALIGIGAAIVGLPWYAITHEDFDVISDLSPGWGMAIIGLGVLLYALARRQPDPAWPALAMLALVLLIKLAVAQGTGVRYNPWPIAEAVRAAQDRGQPIVHMGWHHGVYEFAARLLQPLPTLGSLEELADWAQRHPDGLVMSFYPTFRFRAPPVYTQPFRGTVVSIWNVRDALASGVDRNAATADPAISEAVED